MTFRELYEAEANKTVTTETPKETPKEEKKDNPQQQATTPGTIDDVINAINDANTLVDFFTKITRASNTSINVKINDNKVTTIKLKKDDKLIAPTDEFDKFANAVKSKDSSWEDKLLANKSKFTKNDTSSNSKTTADYIATTLIPLIKKPSAPIGKDGKILNNNNIRSGSNEYGHEQDYYKFGQAMVFFSAKCCSKLTDINTKIDQKAFDHIMQGVFGESGGKSENDSFLTQFITIRPKMKIDAAKAVIASKTSNAKNDQGYQGSVNNNSEQMDDSFKDMSYYERISFMLRLDEDGVGGGDTDTPENGDNGSDNGESKASKASKGAYPKTVSDFSELAEIALKQAEMVEKKHHKEFKIQFDKLEKAFNAGVESYQKQFKEGFKGKMTNPLTGRDEDIGARGVNAFLGGPKRFIEDNPMLKKLCDDIKNGQKWDIFNAPAKLMLKLFDIMEAGGNILQKFIDDVDDALKGLHQYFDRVKPDKFREMIKTAINDGDYKEAESLSVASSMVFISNLFNTLANGPYGIINTTKHSFTTAEENGEVPMRTVAKRAEEALQMTIQTGEGFAKWKAEKDKENKKKINDLEEKIKNKESGEKTNTDDGSKPDSETEGSNNPAPAQNASYKPRSFLSFLNEESSDGNGDKESSAEDSVDDLKKQLEELKEKVNKETAVDLERFAAVLDEFKKTTALRNEIKNNVLPWFKKLYFENEAAANDFIETHSNTAQDDPSANVESADGKADIQDSVTIKNIVLEPIILEGTAEGGDDYSDDHATEDDSGENKGQGSAPAGSGEKEGQQDQSNDGEPEGKWQDEAAKSHAAMIALLEAAAESKFDEGTIRTISNKLDKSDTVLEGIKIFKDMLKNFLPMLENTKDIVPFKEFVVNTTDEDAKDLLALGFEVHKERQTVEKDGENDPNAAIDQNFFEKCDETIKSTIGKELSTILTNMKSVLDKAQNDSWIGEYENLNKELDKTVDNFKKYLNDVLFVAAKSDAADDDNTKVNAIEHRDAYIKAWEEFMNSNPAFLPKLYYFLNMYNKIRKFIETGKKNTMDKKENFFSTLGKPVLFENNEQTQENQEAQPQSGTPEAEEEHDNGHVDDGNGMKYISGAYLKATLVDNSSEVYSQFFNQVFPDNINHDWYQHCIDSKGADGWQTEWNKNATNFGERLGLRAEQSKLHPVIAVRSMCDENTGSKTVLANYKNAGMAKSIDYVINSTKTKTKWDLFGYLCALRACATVIVKLLEEKGKENNETMTMQFGSAANKATNANNQKLGDKSKERSKNDHEAAVNRPVSDRLETETETSSAPSGAPAQNASYIPEYSPDALINEIYKYIR